MPSFRANLLHGSLETRRANWFLHCFFFFFFDLLHCARISGTVFSNGTNKQGPVCLFGTGRRTGELVNTRAGRGRGRGWMEGSGGRRGGKVVGVIPLLEPVALTLTVAWKPNQSVSIHAESGFLWADSTRLYDTAASLNTAACSICQ